MWTYCSLFVQKYIVSFLDDFTYFGVIYSIDAKSKVLDCWKNYIAHATALHQVKVSKIRCDNGGEYSGAVFKNFCGEQGIEIEYTPPYTPEHNGSAERLNRTLIERARAMLIEAGAPRELWEEAVRTAMYLTNRVPSDAIGENSIPYLLWSKRKPSGHHLRTFGCAAYALVAKEKRTKLDPKSRKLIMVGYSPSGYRLYDPVEKSITISRDVVFKEDELYEDIVSGQIDKVDAQIENVIVDSIENVIIDDETIAMNVTVYDIPQNYEEIKSRSDCELWNGAMQEEAVALAKNETWILVNRPTDKEIIDSRWVICFET